MRELVKPFLCLLVIAACLVAVAACVTPIYDYKSGYQEGYNMGYSDGHYGHFVGFYNPPEYLSDHSAEYNKGLLEGYDEGYTQGARTFFPRHRSPLPWDAAHLLTKA